MDGYQHGHSPIVPTVAVRLAVVYCGNMAHTTPVVNLRNFKMELPEEYDKLVKHLGFQKILLSTPELIAQQEEKLERIRQQLEPILGYLPPRVLAWEFSHDHWNDRLVGGDNVRYNVYFEDNQKQISIWKYEGALCDLKVGVKKRVRKPKAKAKD